MSDRDKFKDLEDKILNLSIRVKRMEEFIRAFPNTDEYLGIKREPTADAGLEDVIRLVCQFNTASASFLQRKMSIGYSRAARLIDQLEDMGIVGPEEGSKPREVLIQNAKAYFEKLEKS